jgi:hypothetical protein
MLILRTRRSPLLLLASGACAFLGALGGAALSGCSDDLGAALPANAPFAGTDYTYPDGKTHTAATGTGSHAVEGTGPPLGPVGFPVPAMAFDGVVEGAAPSLPAGAATVISHPCGAPPCATGPVPAGQLTAGEWNDLGQWSFFVEMLGRPANDGSGTWGAATARWGLFPTSRIPVSVVAGRAPAANVPVQLLDAQGAVLWSAVTDKHGDAQLFAGLFAPEPGPFTVRAGTPPGVAIGVAQVPPTATPVTVTLPLGDSYPPALDLMLMVDTTGSMGDELTYIKAELEDVVSRVKDRLPPGATVRLSVNFYKDLQDEYVVRAYPFTTDVAADAHALSLETAGGGADFPEAVDHALQVAVDGHDWNPRATARLLFLVLDAPPHDDAASLARVHDALASAARQGIEIIPVGASGIDKSTELLLRFFAVATNGSYAFLTDDSGLGNAHLDPSPTIGAFNVELLNDLLVRVIADRV